MRLLVPAPGVAVLIGVVLATAPASAAGARPAAAASPARLSRHETETLNAQRLAIRKLLGRNHTRPPVETARAEALSAAPVRRIIAVIVSSNAGPESRLARVPSLPRDEQTVNQFLDAAEQSLLAIGAQGQELRLVRFSGKLAEGFAGGG